MLSNGRFEKRYVTGEFSEVQWAKSVFELDQSTLHQSGTSLSSDRQHSCKERFAHSGIPQSSRQPDRPDYDVEIPRGTFARRLGTRDAKNNIVPL